MSADGGGSRGRLASLAMYREPSEITAATRAFWAYVRRQLRERGVVGVPEELDEAIPYDAAWLDPRLLLAQTCGYPFASRLRGRVRLVATPVYDHPGCDGTTGGSFVVTRVDSPAATIADMRGAAAVINGWDSNSGMNLLRRLVAPHAIGGRFFGRVIESGSHLASLASVASGAADVAAIDCVTYGNVARFAPERLAGTRILAETARAPALPLITRGSASGDEVAALRDALIGLAEDPAARSIREALGLRGFAVLPERAYEAVLAVEREAVSLGYPELA